VGAGCGDEVERRWLVQKYQVRYDRPSRTFGVWVWGAPKQRDACVADAFRRETDAYHWINANTTKEDKVYPTIYN